MAASPNRLATAIVFSAMCLLVVALADDPNYQSHDIACSRCSCIQTNEDPMLAHYVLDCSARGLQHILSGWPDEFGQNHTGHEIVAAFSGNSIKSLPQLPPSDGALSFSCRHCELTEIVSAAFIDTPHIIRLDLSWNELTGAAIRSDIFRGRYNTMEYEPIALAELDLSHNRIHSIEERAFEHTPALRRVLLADNPLVVLDLATSLALSGLRNMEHLDLSYTGIAALSDGLFRHMPKLSELLVQGNKLKTVPESIGELGDSLKCLYIGDNLISKITDESFLGLKALTHLNISAMPALDEIGAGTFLTLSSLEVLIAKDNGALKTFSVGGLRGLHSIRELDLSNCALTALDSEPVMTDALEAIGGAEPPEHFPRLRSLKLAGNAWHCDCRLFNALKGMQHHGSTEFHSDDDARCATPYDLSGTRLSELILVETMCKMADQRKAPRIPLYEPPQFLRPRSLVLSILSVTTVVVIGLIVGLAIVTIKKKLRDSEFGFASPVRYTTVRNSTMSTVTT